MRSCWAACWLKLQPSFDHTMIGEIVKYVRADGGYDQYGRFVECRDLAGVLTTKLPIWSQGVAASPSVAGLTFVNWQEPIACGGVAVFPDDIVVGDEDGAVLIPASIVDTVLDLAPEQERLEAWIMREVQAGAVLPGLYPPNADNKSRYEATKAH